MPKSEIDEFLADVGDDSGADDFIKEDANPLESKVEEPKESAPSKEDDEDLPFHKNPKVQRYIDKEISKRIKESKPPEVVPKEVKDTMGDDELTDTLTEIIGNDTPQKLAAIKKFRSQLGRLEERGAEKALGQLREQAEAEQKEEAEAIEEITNAFENLEEQFDVDLTSNTTVARKERSDFIDFIKRISPKDSNGDVVQYPDFEETWKLYQTTKKPTENKRAKDISSRSMSRTSSGDTTVARGNSWSDVDRIFNQLQK